MSNCILYEVKDRKAYITLNRPDKRNALNKEMINEVQECFRMAERGEMVKIVILTGSGSAFCAGADLAYLNKLKDFSPEENLQDSEQLKTLFLTIYRFPKPVIARVNGHAIAGGCGLATVCDFVYSATHAKFGYTEVKIGFVPALVLVFLIKKIGEARASNLLLSGELITAREAMSIGMIHHVCEPENLTEEVEELAERLLIYNSAESMKLTKNLIKQVQDLPLEEALSIAAKANAESRMTEDWNRGISAFLNKKSIKW